MKTKTIGGDHLLVEGAATEAKRIFSALALVGLIIVSLTLMFWCGMVFEQNRHTADIKVYLNEQTVDQVSVPAVLR